MIKLLRNFIREQKNNLLQIFGLGFLVIIMIVTYLALNFANSYVKNAYFNDIAGHKFNQEITFNNLKNTSFYGKYRSLEQIDAESYLDNINYYQKDNNIDKVKMAKATFRLEIAKDSTVIRERIYRFIFHSDNDNIHIGDNLFKATGKSFFYFKINVPKNYPTLATHDKTMEDYAEIIEKYVYDPSISNIKNKTNFMITSEIALKCYKDNFVHQYPNQHNYDETDISNQAKLYQIMTMGMLYQNIEWNHVHIINDLLVTSKNFAFIKIGPDYFVNKPIIVKNGGVSLKTQPLKDDEILIYQQFAKLNNLKINDNYIIAGQSFKIRGYVTNSIVASVGYYFNNVIDLKNNTVAFTNSNTMHKVNEKLAPFKNQLASKDNFFASSPQLGAKKLNNSWMYDYLHQIYLKNINQYNISYIKNFYFTDGIDFNYLMLPINNHDLVSSPMEVQHSSVASFSKRIEIINNIANLFLGLIFIITVIIIFIIIFKMIDRNKKLMGVLKATGYHSWQLSITLVLSIIISLLVFALVGVVLSIPLTHYLIIITNINVIALISYGWYFSFATAIWLIIIPIVSLTIISFLLTLFLLRIKPLDLITNNYSTKQYRLNVSGLFVFITRKIIKNFSYHNKLAITTSMRSFGKILLMSFTAFFAATLVFFSLAASGLINNMLGSQFAGTNFQYQNLYQFDNEVKANFISSENKLMYQFNSVTNIKHKYPLSLYSEIDKALTEFLKNPTSAKSIMINFQNRYIMGSELLLLRQRLNDNYAILPSEVKHFLNDNVVLIDYLTNNNGKNSTDIMVTFGLVPFDSKNEVPYTQLNFSSASNVKLLPPNYQFDNDTQTMLADYVRSWAAPRTVYGIDDNLNDFLSPSFAFTTFASFSDLSLESISQSTKWQDQNFMVIRDKIIKQLNIKDPKHSAVQIIPMATSVLKSVPNVFNGGETLGTSIIYSYQGFDQKPKYIIGISYDVINKLDPSIILMPKKWLNSAIFGQNHNLSINDFGNSKLSKFNDNEFKHYLPIISNKNDYNLDLVQMLKSDYLTNKGITTALSSVLDISNLRSIMKTNQYSLQAVITFFGIFSVILAFMIIIIITNISVRDNLILINILRSLGYTVNEVSYHFFIIMIPILTISTLFSVFIAPILVQILASLLTIFANKIIFLVVLRWWYFALIIGINIMIYLISYFITWKLNINNQQLMTLTK